MHSRKPSPVKDLSRSSCDDTSFTALHDINLYAVNLRLSMKPLPENFEARRRILSTVWKIMEREKQ